MHWNNFIPESCKGGTVEQQEAALDAMEEEVRRLYAGAELGSLFEASLKVQGALISLLRERVL